MSGRCLTPHSHPGQDAVVAYRAIPSGLFPDTPLPELVVLPGPDILDTFAVEVLSGAQAEQEAFRLRYEVYCRELGWEPGGSHPTGCECDADDDRAVQFLFRHRASGRAVATFRLVLADPLDPLAPFPFERHCPMLLPGMVEQDPVRRLGCVEPSRFCVLPAVRHGGPDGPVPWELSPESWRREWPHRRGLGRFMVLVAAHAMVAIGIDWAYVLSEAGLRAILRSSGFPFARIGPDIEWKGRRSPSRLGRPMARAGLVRPEARVLGGLIAERLRPALARHPLLAIYPVAAGSGAADGVGHG
ncbi:MAG: PEP-CTERM/exosortase system-associated acyltransferase [Planctomycetes bacterium]|nr:PEP-CTERM/exosortase system-associated acyltransferase [Planctomycetota bacterium]